jgi:hypothetical protein
MAGMNPKSYKVDARRQPKSGSPIGAVYTIAKPFGDAPTVPMVIVTLPGNGEDKFYYTQSELVALAIAYGHLPGFKKFVETVESLLPKTRPTKHSRVYDKGSEIRWSAA